MNDYKEENNPIADAQSIKKPSNDPAYQKNKGNAKKAIGLLTPALIFSVIVFVIVFLLAIPAGRILIALTDAEKDPKLGMEIPKIIVSGIIEAAIAIILVLISSSLVNKAKHIHEVKRYFSATKFIATASKVLFWIAFILFAIAIVGLFLPMIKEKMGPINAPTSPFNV